MNELSIILTVGCWLTFAGFTSYIASQKGRDAGGWGVIGLFFGIFALIAICAVPALEKKPEGKRTNSRVTTTRDVPRCPVTGELMVEVSGQLITLSDAKSLGFIS